MWSPTVAKHDHTFTDAGSRPAFSAPGFREGALHGRAPPRGGLAREERGEPALVEAAPAEREAVRSERNEAHRQVLGERRVEVQDRPRSGGPFVADDHLAAEQAPHEA